MFAAGREAYIAFHCGTARKPGVASKARITDRRRLIGAAGAAMMVAMARSLGAPLQAKVSKREAQYQDEPRDIRMCATCTLFEAPRACKVVQGDVSPKGWCKFFALVD
jgi:hypothetical protein